MNSELLFNVLRVFIPILAITAVFRAVNRGSYMAIDTIESWEGSRIRDVMQNGRIVFPATLTIDLLKGLTRFVRLFVILITLAIYVPLVLNLFASTQWIATTVFDATQTQLAALQASFIAFLPTLLYFLVLGLIVHYSLKVIQLFFSEIEKEVIVLPYFDNDWARPTFQLFRGLVVLITAVYMYTQIPGSETITVQGAVVLTSLVAGIGAKDVITDIVSGVVLTYTRTFRVGDRVEIGNVKGQVRDKTLVVTRIRTAFNDEISIPNAKVLRSQVLNLSTLSQNNLLMETSVTVSYEVPWRVVEELLLEAAEKTADILQTANTPKVLQSSLDDFYVRFQLVFHTSFTDNPLKRLVVRNALHQNIRDIFKQANVNLITPQYMHAYANQNRQLGVGGVEEMTDINIEG